MREGRFYHIGNIRFEYYEGEDTVTIYDEKERPRPILTIPIAKLGELYDVVWKLKWFATKEEPEPEPEPEPVPAVVPLRPGDPDYYPF